MTNMDAVTELLEQTPDSLADLLAAISPDIYASLKQSVELQKWPDGARLSPTQLENTMQLIILYEHQNLPEELRTGQPLNQGCGTDPDGPVQAIDVIDMSDNKGVLDS